MLLVRSYVARSWKAPGTLVIVHSACVLELSLSRYLSTSNTRLVVLPSGSATLSKARPEPLETKILAEV